MTSCSRALLVLLLICLLPASGITQLHRAVVRGLVVDPAGALLPDAEVTLTRVETGEIRRTISDGAGRFTVPQLVPGTFRVEVRHDGYRVFTSSVELNVGQELWLDVSLEAGAVTEAIEVFAPVVPIDRHSPAVSTVVDARQVAGLPLDGRNFLELALLAPGTAPAPQGSASSVRGDFAFSANGAREDFNAYLLDGVHNIDPKLGTPGVRPPVDAIREFEVATSTYDASFGRNAGGQVNVITRSGSNRVDGTLYEFYRGGALNARHAFAPRDEPEPEYSRHQFGGSIGGPILRDRAFFFADYEGTRLREGITRITNVPTAAERQGDFSQSLFARPRDPLSGQPLPGGQIPSFFQHPVGAAIAALYPLPNRDVPFANFVSSPVLRDDVHQFDARVDQVLGGGGRLTGRYSFSDRRLYEPFAGPGFSSLPGFGHDVARRGQNAAVTHTRVLGASLLNDLRIGFNRVSIGVTPEGAITNRQVGLPSLSPDPSHAGLSLINVAGYSPLGTEYNNPQASTSDALQIASTATWMRGGHLVKLGVDWSGIRQSAFRDVQARGFLTFIDQAYTGNALADLLLGLPVLTGGARLDNPQNLRAAAWSLFAQDDWRLTPALTLSAGLRYDYVATPVDADDRANVYDSSTGQLVTVGTAGIPRGGYRPDRDNFAPRAGFAWTLDAAGLTVLRGGYGIYYNQGALATSEGLYFNPPYFNLSVYFPAQGLPPLTLTDPFPAFFPVPIPPSATAFQRDLQTPWLEHWNVNLQRQLGRTRAIEVGYVGSRGHDLISARDMNQPAPSPSPLNLRPNPLFADIILIESRASSRYNALQGRFQQRDLAGLSLLASYTLGRSTDDASGFFTSAGDPNFPQDSRNPETERSRSSFDVRHRLSASFAYALPFGEGRRWATGAGLGARVLSDWEVQGVVTLQGGRPFTVAIHPDIDVSNTGRSNLGFGYNDRPNVTGDPSLSNPTAAQWFNTAAFTFPAFGTFGNAGRNILDGPGYRNVNLALVRYVPVGATSRLQLRAEAFNLFNRVNLDLPDAFLGSPTFGQILSAQAPRRVQLGARLVF